MNDIKLILGDCIEETKKMEDKSVDLCLTDFPYGVGVDYGSTYNDTQENLKNLIKVAMPEILRVSKRVMITCGHTNIWKYPEAKWVMAWVNPAGNNRSSWGFTCWQPILCYGKDPYLENGMGARQDIFIHNEISEKSGHPCPKPIGLWKKLLLRGSVKKEDIIFDPFLGSGTTGVICKEFGMDFIGIEISPQYYKIAQERIKNTTPPLF